MTSENCFRCVRSACWAPCTGFPVTADGGAFCGTHINWREVTYDGALQFDDYTARGFLSSVFLDDDYTFNMTSTGGAGLAGRNTLHPEMSFLETVDRYHTKFWEDFHSRVDQVPGDDLSGPRSLFDGRYAIVIGLQGLDTQHGIHEELHPIYAMALRRTANPGRNCWAIFARNWGNEGGCSSHDHPLDVDHITFHLPQPGATAVTEISREFLNDSGTAVSEVGLVKDGAEITLFLGRPEDKTQVNGEICLRWAVPPGAQPLSTVAAGPPEAGPEVDGDQPPGLRLLTPAQLAQLGRSLPASPARDKSLDMRVARRVPFVRRPVPPPVVRHRVGKLDAQKAARERQIHDRVCEVLRGHPERPKDCDQR